MELKTCPKCQKPILASVEKCPHCPEEYEWNPDSWLNVGCLLLIVLFVFLTVFLSLLLMFGAFLRF